VDNVGFGQMVKPPQVHWSRVGQGQLGAVRVGPTQLSCTHKTSPTSSSSTLPPTPQVSRNMPPPPSRVMGSHPLTGCWRLVYLCLKLGSSSHTWSPECTLIRFHQPCSGSADWAVGELCGSVGPDCSLWQQPGLFPLCPSHCLC